MADILDELAAALSRGRNDYPRQMPLAGNIPPSTSSDPVRLPSIFGDPQFSLEMQGGYARNPRDRYQAPFTRQILQSILGGGFPVPQPQGSISSEGWAPGIGLRARFPF